MDLVVSTRPRKKIEFKLKTVEITYNMNTSSEYSDASSEYSYSDSTNSDDYKVDFSAIFPDEPCDHCNGPCPETSYQPYETRDGYLCGRCVSVCSDCQSWVLKTRHQCHDCEYSRLALRIKFIQRTPNNITKKLPAELVNQIISLLMT